MFPGKSTEKCLMCKNKHKIYEIMSQKYIKHLNFGTNGPGKFYRYQNKCRQSLVTIIGITYNTVTLRSSRQWILHM